MATLFALFPVGIGLLVWWLGIKGMRLARRQRDWPAAAGTIIESSVKTRDVTIPLLGTSTMRTTGWSGSGIPKVTYEYEVDGKRYTGSNVGAPPRDRRRGRTQPAMDFDLALFDKGRAVQVYYDPANPSDAVLFKAHGGGCALVMLWFVGGVFMAIGMIAWTVISAIPK